MTPTELTCRDGAPLHPAPEMTDTDLARLMVFQLAKAMPPEDRAKVAPPRRATKERPCAAPAVPQAAEQAPAEPAPPTDHYGEVQAAIRAERDAARAEKRLEQPVTHWGDMSQQPRAGQDFTAPHSNVTRFRPRSR